MAPMGQNKIESIKKNLFGFFFLIVIVEMWLFWKNSFQSLLLFLYKQALIK